MVCVMVCEGGHLKVFLTFYLYLTSIFDDLTAIPGI